MRINPNITVEVSAGPGSGRGRARPDAINQVVSVGSKLTEDASAPGPGEFGVEKVTYKVDNIIWTHRPATKTVDVNARIFLDIKWGVHSLGNTNVSGSTDAAVTKTTWKEIADDLRPDGTGRPTRDKYWAEDLTRRHEKFHATDDIGRANTYLPTARAWLGTQTVSAGSVEADVKAHLESMRAKVEADGWPGTEPAARIAHTPTARASYAGRVTGIEALAATNKW